MTIEESFMKFEQNESPNEFNLRKFTFLMIAIRKGIIYYLQLHAQIIIMKKNLN